MKKVHLMMIDPQVDFCDPSGALFDDASRPNQYSLAAAKMPWPDFVDTIS